MSEATTAQPEAPEQGDTVFSHLVMGWSLIVAGVAGVWASMALTVERSAQVLAEAEGRPYKASCDYNALISCGSVMKTPEAEIFGFPNSLLGLVTFGAIIAAGGAILLGQRFKPLFWWALIAGQFAGVVMVHFLMYTSIIVLQALCPWCVLTWFATIPTFVLTCAYAVSGGFVKLPAIIRSTAENAAHYYPLVLLGWMGVIIVAMLLKFLI